MELTWTFLSMTVVLETNCRSYKVRVSILIVARMLIADQTSTAEESTVVDLFSY